MPEINEQLIRLNYEPMKQMGVINTDFNTFRANMLDPVKAREIYSELQKKGKPVAFNEWYSAYGVPTSTKTAPTTAQDQSSGVAEVQLPDSVVDAETATQPVVDMPIPVEPNPIQQNEDVANKWISDKLLSQLKKEYNDSLSIKARNLSQPVQTFDYNADITPEEATGLSPVTRSIKPTSEWRLPTKEESQEIVDKDFYDRVRNIAYETSVGGELDMSNKLIDQAQTINPKDPYLHRLKAFNFKAAKDFENATKSIDKAIDISEKQESVAPGLYLDKAGIELESGNIVSAYTNADKYIKMVGGVSSDETGLKDLAEAHRIKAVIGKAMGLDKVPAGNNVSGSKYDIDLSNYKSALSQSKSKVKERQDQEISSTLKTMPDYLLASPYNGFSLIMGGFQGASEAMDKIKQSVEGEREVFNEIAPGITKKEIEELDAGTRAVMLIGGLWGLGMSAGSYAMPGSLGERKMISHLMLPELALFSTQAAAANIIAPGVSEKVLAPITASRIAMGMDAPESELGKEALVVGDMIGFMVLLHGAKAVSQSVGNTKAIKDIADKANNLYSKIAERKPLTEEEYVEVDKIIQETPKEVAEIYESEIKPEIKTIVEQTDSNAKNKSILEALETAKQKESSIPQNKISEFNGKEIAYNGVRGTLTIDEGGKVTIETKNAIHELSAKEDDLAFEFGIEEIKAAPKKYEIIIKAENEVFVNGIQYKVIEGINGNIIGLQTTDNYKNTIKNEPMLVAVEIERNRELDNKIVQWEPDAIRSEVSESNGLTAKENVLVEGVLNKNMTDVVDIAITKIENNEPLTESEKLQVELWAMDAIETIDNIKSEINKTGHEYLNGIQQGISNILKLAENENIGNTNNGKGIDNKTKTSSSKKETRKSKKEPRGKPKVETAPKTKTPEIPVAPKAEQGTEVWISGVEYISEYKDAKELAHGVKNGDDAAIKKMAQEMALNIPNNATIVPMVDRNGVASNMLSVANEISKINGNKVANIILGEKRESLYELKKEGRDISNIDLGLKVSGEIPQGEIYVIDNVVGTGKTAKSINEILPNAKILVHSVDKSTVDQSIPIQKLKSKELLTNPKVAETPVVPKAEQGTEIGTEAIEPIRQLGTGANVYFETPKYRVNDFKDGKVLLNITDTTGEVVMGNVEFSTAKEAVYVAKRLSEDAPEGLIYNYHNIDKIIDNYKKEYNEATTSTQTTEPIQTATKTDAKSTEAEQQATAEVSKAKVIEEPVAVIDKKIDNKAKELKAKVGETNTKLKEQKKDLLEQIREVKDALMKSAIPDEAKHAEIEKMYTDGVIGSPLTDADIQVVKDLGYEVNDKGMVKFEVKDDGVFNLHYSGMIDALSRVKSEFPEKVDNKPSIQGIRGGGRSRKDPYTEAVNRGSLKANETEYQNAKDNLSESIRNKNKRLEEVWQKEFDKEKEILKAAKQVDWENVRYDKEYSDSGLKDRFQEEYDAHRVYYKESGVYEISSSEYTKLRKAGLDVNEMNFDEASLAVKILDSKKTTTQHLSDLKTDAEKADAEMIERFGRKDGKGLVKPKNQREEYMINSMQRRIDKYEQVKNAIKKISPKVENEINKVVLQSGDWSKSAIDAIQKLKIDTKDKLYDATLGIPVALWNTSLDMIIAGIKAGKAVEIAVKDAIAYIKKEFPAASVEDYKTAVSFVLEPVLDKSQYDAIKKIEFKEDLPMEPVKETPPPAKPTEPVSVSGIPEGMKESKSWKQIEENPRISTEAKEGLRDEEKARSYVPIKNAITEDEAIAIIQRKGLERTISMLKDTDGLRYKNENIHPATVSMLRDKAMLEADRLFMENYGKDQALTDYYFDLFQEATVVRIVKGTEAAQSLQAMARFSNPTRELYKAQRAARETRNKEIEKNENNIKKEYNTLSDINEKEVDNVINSPEVQKVVRKVTKKTEADPNKPKKELSNFQKKIKAEQEYRDSLLKGIKKSDFFLATAGGLSPKGIEIVGNMSLSYIKEAYFRSAQATIDLADIAAKVAKKLKKSGIDIDPAEIQKHIKDPNETGYLDELKVEKDQLDMEANAEEIAKRVMRRLSSKSKEYDPVKEMINTLFGKIDEKLPPKEKGKGEKAADKIKNAVKDKKTYKETWDAAKEEVDRRIKNMNVAKDIKDDYHAKLKSFYDETIGRPYSEKQVGRAVSETMKSMDMRIGEVIRKHYTHADASGRSLVDRLIEETGVSGEDAVLLANSVRNTFNTLLYKTKLNALNKALTIKERRRENPKNIKSAHEALIELSNMGAFDYATFTKMWADKMKLPNVTQEQAIEIKRLAQRVQDAPDGRLKNMAVQDLLTYHAKMPGIDWGEVGLGFFYANILSRVSTQQKNVMGNTVNYMAAIVEESFTNPSVVPMIFARMFDSYSKGLTAGHNVLLTGHAPLRGKSVDVPSASEQWKFKFKLANAAKYVSRVMMGADAVNYEVAKDLRAYSLAKAIASERGIKAFDVKDGKFFDYKKVWQEVDAILNQTPEKAVEAKKIAEADVDRFMQNIGKPMTEAGKKTLRENLIKLRTREIMEQGRDAKIIEETNDFAARLTYNHKTEGMLGLFSDAVGYLANKGAHGKILGKEVSVKPLKFVVPFTRVVSNVANRALDFDPFVGSYRLLRGGVGMSLESTRFGDKSHRYDLYEKKKALARIGVGIAAQTALFLLTQEDEKGESAIEITANGYGDWQKNEVLRNNGWKPYSVKIGDRYYSYQYTPFILLFAPVGFYRDSEKYNSDHDDDAFLKKYTMAYSQNIKVFSDMSFVASVSALMKAVSSSDQSEFTRYMGQMGNMAKGIVIPGLASETSQRIQAIMEMPKKDADNLWKKFIVDIPVARNYLNDKVNIFGEPVLSNPNVLVSKDRATPQSDFIVENNLPIGIPKRESEGLMLFNSESKTYEPMTDNEWYSFMLKRGQYVKDGITELMTNTKLENEFINNALAAHPVKAENLEKAKEMIRHEYLSKRKTSIVSYATKKAMLELYKDRISTKPGLWRDLEILNEEE